MLTSARMSRIRIIVLKREVEAATEALGRLGALQLAESEPVEGASSDHAPALNKIERCEELRVQCLDGFHSRQQRGQARVALHIRCEPSAASTVQHTHRGLLVDG